MKTLFTTKQVSLREVFDAWKLKSVHGMQRRMRNKIEQMKMYGAALVCVFVRVVVVLTSVPVCGWRSPLTREREQLEYTLDIETKKLQRTQRALERSNEENSQLRADLRMLKANSHRTQLVLHLRKVIGSLTHTVRTLTATSLSLLHKGAVEAVSMPDASRLWEVMRQEDIEAAAAAQRAANKAVAAAEQSMTESATPSPAASTVVMHAHRHPDSHGAEEVADDTLPRTSSESKLADTAGSQSTGQQPHGQSPSAEGVEAIRSIIKGHLTTGGASGFSTPTSRRSVTFKIADTDASESDRPTSGDPASPRSGRGWAALRAHVKSVVAIKRMRDRVARKSQTMHTPDQVRRQFRPLSSGAMRRAQRFMASTGANTPRRSDTDMTDLYDEDDEAGWGYDVRTLAEEFKVSRATDLEIAAAAEADNALVASDEYESLSPLEKRIRYAHPRSRSWHV